MRVISPIERTFRDQLTKFGSVLFTSEQTFVASCPEGTEGEPVSVTRSASSYLSQEDADSIALRLATEEATAELVCQYQSTQCVIPSCEFSYQLCRDGASFVSQEDATSKALAAANAAAIAYCAD